MPDPSLHPPLFHMSQTHSISRFASLVFDLDGTLVDSAADITAAMSMTMTDLGLPPLPQGYIMPNLHSTADTIIGDVFRDLGHPPPEDMQATRALFYDHYARFGHATSVLYPGAREFLRSCADRGQKLAICTNKRENTAREVLALLDVLDCFQAITGCDTYEEPKPSAVPLLRTLERMGVSRDEAVFFGDTQADAECAQRSQVGFALHRPGYGAQAAARFPRLLAFDHYSEFGLPANA